MIIILSPSKTLNFDKQEQTSEYSLPDHLDDAAYLVEELRKFKPAELQKLMDVNPRIAETNFERYASWSKSFQPGNAKQSLLAFRGDVYQTLAAEELDAGDLTFAQEHIRILSGLYGILRPLDLMKPYRLEMGTELVTEKGKDLYEFWGNKIHRSLEADIKKQDPPVLINLASKEYANVLNLKEASFRMITPVFKQIRDEGVKMVPILAKRARGTMSRYIIDHRITNPEDLKAFDYDGYFWKEELSSENEWVFVR